ncbi:MAG: hypothetical protein J2P28_18705 [Actinobacteria bacterium]|nr:hypothetical protein [Actinomycetota bacterium]MBO0837520.1 hypothetical protein [Actinomycetota bacterium]
MDRIPLRRGSLLGLLLVLLGIWGGLGPVVGPYIHFGYTPDKTMVYNTQGRLDYSIIPGAVVLLGGLIAMLTRNRGMGVFAGLIAAAGGAWFTLGQDLMRFVLKKNIHAGSPIVHGSATALRTYLETFTLFTGLGVLIVVIGAIAMGRFSLLGVNDLEGDTYYDATHAGDAVLVR